MDIKQTLGVSGFCCLAVGSIAFLAAPVGQWMIPMLIAGIGVMMLTVLLFTKTTDSVFNWVNSFKHDANHQVDIDESKLKGSWSNNGKRK